MTVAELIKRLQAMPANLPVKVDNTSYFWWEDVDNARQERIHESGCQLGDASPLIDAIVLTF